MALWLPAIKIILPYVSQIVSAAIPAFTKKTDKSNTEVIVPSQIAELQAAATQNAESLKTLALQLQQVISGIDAAASKMEQEIKTAQRLAVAAIILALIAIGLWLS
jgi:Na+-transporting NADH:ubiquinone oxidoreductase subunit NqrC